MRITAFMIYNQFSKSLSKNLSELGKVQEQLSSGRKLTKPSDDVIALRGAMSYKVSINAIEQFNRNIDEGISTLGLTENLLRSSENILSRARELAVSASSDTSTSTTRKMTSYEVRNLFSELLDIGNTRLRNKYVFSGYKTSTQSFSSSGAYQGDSNSMEIYVSDGIKAKINVPGDTAFSDTAKLISSDLTGETLAGTLRITTGSGNPVDIPVKDGSTSASPEEIRDTVNAPMTGYYTDGTSAVGTGTLTIKAGTDDAVTVEVNSGNGNTTVSSLASYINANVTGIEARLATDATTGQVRLFFRPTTAGTPFTIEVSDDDGNDTDTSGLSALLHTELKSNLTANALGIEAFVINGDSDKRLLFAPTVAGTSFTIAVDEDGNGNFSDAGDTDGTGLSLLYHASSTSTNLTGSISFFKIIEHFANSLLNNDTAGIRGSIYLLDGAIDSVVNTTADVGSRLKYLEDQKKRLEENNISYQQSLSSLQDADIAEVALSMTKIQSTLQAMRISSLKSLSQSLFDFLR